MMLLHQICILYSVWVNEKTITPKTFDFQEWYDRRLSWNKTEQDNMEYIFAKQSEIWYPELINDNSYVVF